MRRAWVLGLAAAIVGFSACSGSKPVASTAPSPAPTAAAVVTGAPTTTVPEPPGASAFSVAPAEVAAWNAPPEFPDGARAGVQALLDRYLTECVLRPLRTGEPAANLATIFAASTLDRLGGPDRAGLVDDGLPKVDSVRVEAASADIVALTGLSIVSAGIHVLVAAKVGGVPVRIERTGELQLSADGDAWKVIGYDIRVARDTPGGSTVTTVQGGHS